MGDRAAKDALFEALAGAAKALGSGRRAEIVDLLAQGERSVEEIADEIGQSVANTSHHLRAMANAGLLRTRREGTRIIYMLADDSVSELWEVLRRVAAQHVRGIEDMAAAYRGDRSDLEPISRDELAARLSSGDVVVIDVRPVKEYQFGHIAGASSVPLSSLRKQLKLIPEDAEVVAYCRGPFCVFADDAVRYLKHEGFKARRLQDGFPEWKRAGLPVA